MKICNVKISVDFSFLVFIALLFSIENGNVIFSFFTVCFIHEFGHAIALYLSGGRLVSLYFCGIGIKMLPDRSLLMPIKSELFILLCGPAANLAAFLFAGLNCSFATMNLCAAVFNMLPYKLLDGGSIIRLLTESSIYASLAATIVRFIQIILIILSLYAILFIDISLLPLFCTAVFYFAAEYR